MKPSLEKILNTTLKAFMISDGDWKILRLTRTNKAVQVVQAVSIIAYEYGYHPKTIGQFLGKNRTTILYSINKMEDQCSIYKDTNETINKIRESLDYEQCHYSTGYLARSFSGLLTISPNTPERIAGFWVAEGTKPYNDQSAFNQITWESKPVKVSIKVTIEDNEKM